MHVARWGDSLVLRLSDAEAEVLGIKEGDEVAVEPLSHRIVVMSGEARREKALKDLRDLNWSLPEDFRFDRDEANAR